MLIYHPAFDLYSAIFRALRLLDNQSDQAIEIERFRILDFYLLFPFLLRDVEFPSNARKFKKHFLAKPNEYENISDPRRLFMRLEPYQLSALHCLASYSLIEPTLFKEKKVKRSSSPLPKGIQEAITKRNQDSLEIQLLSGPLATISLHGKNGLKSKTDLFEHRYDIN